MKLVCLFFLLFAHAALSEPEEYAVEHEAALAAVDEYFNAFNARDVERFARALHYPHMRINGLGEPVILGTWQENAARIDFDAIARRGNWARTNLDWKKIVQAGDAKVHVMVGYTRYDPDDKPLLSEESLYVVTLHEGRWAIQMRSSFLEQSLISNPEDR